MAVSSDRALVELEGHAHRAGREGSARLSSGWPAACALTDSVMLAAGTATAALGALAADVPAMPLPWVVLAPALTMVAIAARGMYRPRLHMQALDDARKLVAATAVAIMAVVSTRVVIGGDAWEAAEPIRWWVFSSVYLVAGRAGLSWSQRRARERGTAVAPTLIVGAGHIGRLAARRLLEHPEFGLRPVGFLDNEPLESSDGHVDVPVLGASWDLDDVIRVYGIEHVVIAFSTAPHHVLLRIAQRCNELGATVSQVPRLFEQVTDRIEVEHLGGLPLVRVEHTDPRSMRFGLKYALDRIFAALILLVLSPLLAAVAIAVLVTMGRPILFRQERVGLDDRSFRILKFRTMSGDPADTGEANLPWAMAQLDGAEASRVDSDDRRTPLGRILRTTSVDELPQLWNVLVGEMSLVGPRPELPVYAAQFAEALHRYSDRHRVKAGITGWAQVNGLRGSTSLADRVEWDNYYIENWSLWLDLKILLLTVLTVLRFREAG